FKKQNQCPTCRVKIHAAPVLSLTIKNTIDHFIRIKSSDKEKQKRKAQMQIEDDTEDDTGIEIEDDTDIGIEDTDDTEDEDYLLDDSYDTSDSFIDDEEIDYSDKYDI
ncbi:18869_t:CDS:2, partial [Gigaspora margarita]